METRGGRILVTGALGQIGSELVPALRAKYGNGNVIGLDVRAAPSGVLRSGPFEIADATDKAALESVVKKYGISTIYHLASILSAAGEQNPDKARFVNNRTLENVLDIARDFGLSRIFWPSSIAAFGPATPRENTPQTTIQQPDGMYGITKVYGELLMNYYNKRWGVDARSLRYPGLISWKTPPGGGTTDYAVAIFHGALQEGKYECFLKEGTVLPMMYMPDAIRGTMGIMEAPPERIRNRFSYNMAAVSFAPEELAAEIKRQMPSFTCSYVPDSRQQIAGSWPRSIDDSQARRDWGWKHEYGLREMVEDMLLNLRTAMRPSDIGSGNAMRKRRARKPFANRISAPKIRFAAH